MKTPTPRMWWLMTACVSSFAVGGWAEDAPVQTAPVAVSSPAPLTPAAIAEARSIRDKTGAYVSPWLLEVLKLTRSGVEEPVVETFIQTAGTFNLTPDLIIYSRDAGVSSPVITSMMDHDAALAGGWLPPPGPPPDEAALAAYQPPNYVQRIVIHPPREPVIEPMLEEPADSSAPAEGSQPLRGVIKMAPAANAAVYPVREPQAVRLTDPIVVVSGGWRRPNLQILTLFPPPETR